uniref:Uncharacterized protein n=1 Tax=Panagrolaimus davidi TaxID=227884 RepID=A0A914QD61_9BILA
MDMIFCTNIAERGITFKEVQLVLDSLTTKVSIPWNCWGVWGLEMAFIDSGAFLQRLGRGARIQSGVYGFTVTPGQLRTIAESPSHTVTNDHCLGSIMLTGFKSGEPVNPVGSYIFQLQGIDERIGYLERYGAVEKINNSIVVKGFGEMINDLHFLTPELTSLVHHGLAYGCLAMTVYLAIGLESRSNILDHNCTALKNPFLMTHFRYTQASEHVTLAKHNEYFITNFYPKYMANGQFSAEEKQEAKLYKEFQMVHVAEVAKKIEYYFMRKGLISDKIFYRSQIWNSNHYDIDMIMRK